MLDLATDKERKKILNEVDAWFDKRVSNRFSSAKTTAKLAVAEYIANSQGLTLYKEIT